MQEGQYSGQFCEDFPTSPNKCEEIQPCVQCQKFLSEPYTSGPYLIEFLMYGHDISNISEYGNVPKVKCDRCIFDPISIERADYDQHKENLCTFVDDDGCQAEFVYGYINSTGRLQVWVQEPKECPLESDIMGIVWGVLSYLFYPSYFISTS